MIALLVITDGRDDVLAETLASLRENLRGSITRHMIYDDTGDYDHRLRLQAAHPGFEVMQHPAGRQGFGGAIRTAWRHLGMGPERYIAHWEDDFRLCRPIDLDDMADVLATRFDIAQIALRRQAWNPAEVAAGGVVEQHPDDYTEVTSGLGTWLEHRRFFTTNPSLYRRSLTRHGWPDGEHSEGVFSHRLFSNPDVRCAYWGARTDPPLVHHIGAQRVGTGY